MDWQEKMTLVQWFNKYIKKQYIDYNYGCNLIEINKQGKNIYKQSIIPINNNIYINTYNPQYYTIYFFKFYQYYYIFSTNIHNYQFQIINLHNNLIHAINHI